MEEGLEESTISGGKETGGSGRDAPSPGGSTYQSVANPPEVYITNLAVTSGGSNIQGSFDITNTEEYDLQGVTYNIYLIRKDRSKTVFYHRYLYDQSFNLNAGETSSKSFSYSLAPTLMNSGLYAVRVVAVVGTLESGWQDKQVTMPGEMLYSLDLNPYESSVIVNNKFKYDLLEGAIINPFDNAKVEIYMYNPLKSAIVAYRAHKITKLGEREPSEEIIDSPRAFYFRGGFYDKVLFDVPIDNPLFASTISEPGSYLIETYLTASGKTRSPIITYRIVVPGESSTYLSTISYMSAASTLKVETKYVGPADKTSFDGSIRTTVSGGGCGGGTEEDNVNFNQQAQILTQEFSWTCEPPNPGDIGYETGQGTPT
ncbi:hypothetical protein K8R47_00820 [archaeon]|nr:hypothetical protein [archaeon]